MAFPKKNPLKFYELVLSFTFIFILILFETGCMYAYISNKLQNKARGIFELRHAKQFSTFFTLSVMPILYFKTPNHDFVVEQLDYHDKTETIPYNVSLFAFEYIFQLSTFILFYHPMSWIFINIFLHFCCVEPNIQSWSVSPPGGAWQHRPFS